MSDEEIREQGAAQDDRRPAEEQANQQEAYPTYIPPAPAEPPLAGGTGAPPVAPGPAVAGTSQAGRQAASDPGEPSWGRAPQNPNPNLPPGQGSPIVSGPPRSVEAPVAASVFNISTALLVIGGVVLVLVVIILVVVLIGGVAGHH